MNQRILLLSIATLTVTAAIAQDVQNRYGLEKAKANMKTFKTPDGLSASLYAAEPMIQNPTNIDIDPKGRIWAVECLNYRKWYNPKLREAGDRVVILDDTNGDGEADKEITFYQKPDLTNPLGICVLPQPTGTKVIVSAAPNVWLLTDKDGDDKADDAVVIFKLGGVWNYDHQVHAFVFGPDGKFYFNAGNSITDLFWPDGKEHVTDLAGNKIIANGKPYRQGMVFRCDLDLATGKASNVETLGHNFRNNYEVAVDSFGAMWQSDNDDDGNKGVRINYVMEFGNYGFTDEKTGAGWQANRTNLETEIPLRHWHLNDPGVVPNLLQTGGGSPTGILINEGKALGPRFTNQLIHCDAGPRTTRAYPVTVDGAGYKAEMVDVLTSSDSWYRVADCSIAPDGSLYVADWYDPGVGGHNMGDHEPGKVMGRIYHVSATGGKMGAPAVNVSTPEGAVKALQSPNNPTRYLGWAALHAMGEKALPALDALFKSEDPRMRARAFGLLAQIPGKEGEYIQAAAKDASVDLQCFAFRLFYERIVELRAKNLASGAAPSNIPDWVKETAAALFTAAMQSPSPALRRQAVISLRGAKAPQAPQVWAALAAQYDGKDRWYLEALGIGAAGNEDAFFDAWLTEVGEKWNTPAGRDIVWRMRAAKVPAMLAKLLEDKEATHPRYLRAFDFLPESESRTEALVRIATGGKAAGTVAREALTRLKGNQSPAVAKAITGALAEAKGTPQFVELARDFGAKGQGAALLETALKLGNDPIASEAIKLLMNEPDASVVIGTAIEEKGSAPVLNILATSGSKRALGIVTGLLGGDAKPAMRKAAVEAAARTQSGAEAIVNLAKEGKFPEDVKLTAAAALRAVQYPSLTNDITALFPMPSALGGKPLPPIAELAKMNGNVAKGRAVFERTESTCITCHTAGGKGVDVGPALAEIGTKLPKEAIFEAILNPNSGLSMGFETNMFTLKDGGAAVGIVRSETKDEVIISLPGGATQKVGKRDGNITKREKLTTSLMPAGITTVLSQDDLVNLVEYLASLKKK